MRFTSSRIFVTLTCLLAGVSACTAKTRVAAIVRPGDRTQSHAQTPIVLAKDGTARFPITIAANATDETKATAQYLADKLQKITGARFEIEAGDGTTGIILGTIAQFPVEVLKTPLEKRPVIEGVNLQNGVEAYAIRTEPKRLLLLGGGEPGVSHAAARFLDLLGYRRFYPAPEWEVLPSLPNLSFDTNETDRPSILARHIWYAFGTPQDPYLLENMDAPAGQRRLRSSTDLPAWYRQNMLGESFHVFASHNWASIINNNKAEFAAHPEYFSLIGGQRVPRSICVSNAAVRRLAVQNALNYFRKNPDAEMFSMERGDGNASCECDQCRALGNESDRVFGLANEVARGVRKEYPGKMIGVLAYNTHDVPPAGPMEPNVHVQVARLFIQSQNTFRDLVDQWSQKTDNLGIYDYFSTYQWGQDRLRPRANAGPTADLALLRRDIPYLANQGTLSLWSETSVAWGAHGRGNLVATRLMWNPDADVQVILQDFYDKAFGPAAPAMQRYFERVDGDNEYFSKTLLALALRDVNEASTLAKDRPDVLTRLDHIKQFLHYNVLNQRYAEAKDEGTRKDVTLQRITHEFRTRYSYMTHWAAVQNYLQDVATRYKEPSWAAPGWKEVRAAAKSKTSLANPPWLNWNPYSPQETENIFQEDLKSLQPQPLLPSPTFSTDLVPVEFSGAPAPLDSRQSLQNTGDIYLYSLHGEALELEIKSTKGDGATKYGLLGPNGFKTSGELSPDGAVHPVKLQVPASGLYRFHHEVRGIWSYVVAAGRPNTLGLKDQGEFALTSQGDGGRNFFYVPKGTRQFQFYWNGGIHNIYDPTGKIVKTVTTSYDYVTIDVLPGMDGKPWSFNGRYAVRHFVNVPDLFAPSPSSLLVPRELAVKDGLAIRH